MTDRDQPHGAKPVDEIQSKERTNLAKERTMLANERTFLAYVRTTLTFFIAGVTFIQFFDDDAMTLVGWLFLPISMIVMAIGTFSYIRRRRAIVKTDIGP